MNGSDQFEYFSSQQPNIVLTDDIHLESVSSARKYMVIDMASGTTSFTSDKHDASSLKDIHRFVMTNFANLKQEDLDYLLGDGLKHFTLRKNGVLGETRSKIKSIRHFIFNLGISDKKLIERIQAQAARQSISHEFCQRIEQNGLKQHLDTMINLKNSLKEQQDQLDAQHVPSLAKQAIRREAEKIKDQITAQQRQLQAKHNRKQIKTILNAIRPKNEDPLIIQSVKNEFLFENRFLISLMEDVHVKFDPIVEIEVVSVDGNMFEMIESITNFSDRASNSKQVVRGYFRRDPKDLSVNKCVRAFFLKNNFKESPHPLAQW